MLGFLRNFMESHRRQKERDRARRRRESLYARPGMDDFQIEQRIVPTTILPATTRFEWIGGDAGSPTDYNDLNNWRDLPSGLLAANFMTTSSYLQFDANATANCVVGGIHTAVGDVSILKSADTPGAFAFKIEIPANKGLNINNLATSEPDFYGNQFTSDFGSGTIQVDGGTSAGGGGALHVGGGRLNWNGPLNITVDSTYLYKGEFTLWNSITAYIQGPDGSSRECSAHIYDGYKADLTTPSAAIVHENGFSFAQRLFLNDSADVYVSAAGSWHFDQTGFNDEVTGGISGDGHTAQTFTNQGSVFRDGGGEVGLSVPFVSSGHLTVNSNIRIDFLGNDIATYSYVQSGGTTELQNGATIDARKGAHAGLSMTGGSLQTDTVGGAQGTSYLYGDVTISGGIVKLGVGAAGTLQGDNGAWTITGPTTIYFALDPMNVAKSDQIVTTGTITLGSAAGPQPTIDVTYSSSPPAHTFYPLFTGSSVPTATAGVTPVYHGPLPRPIFEADPMGTKALGLQF